MSTSARTKCPYCRRPVQVPDDRPEVRLKVAAPVLARSDAVSFPPPRLKKTTWYSALSLAALGVVALVALLAYFHFDFSEAIKGTGSIRRAVYERAAKYHVTGLGLKGENPLVIDWLLDHLNDPEGLEFLHWEDDNSSLIRVRFRAIGESGMRRIAEREFQLSNDNQIRLVPKYLSEHLWNQQEDRVFVH